MGKGGKEKTQTTNQTTSIDPQTKRFVTQFLRPLGQQGARTALNNRESFFAGPTDAQRQALGRIGQDLSGAGNFGFSPEQMDPSRAQDFFSPFQDEVVSGLQSDFDRQRQQALTRAAQDATAQGAFGGSRSGILQAQALRDVNQDEASTLAQVRNRGFQNAQGLAAQEHQLMQNLGFGSAEAAQRGRLQEAGLGLQQAGQQFGMGEQLRQIQQQRRQEPLFRQRQALQMANMGMGPILGQTTRGRTTTKESGGGLFGNLLGAGLTAAGLFTGGGPLAGAAGGLSGLLGGGGGGGGGALPDVTSPGMPGSVNTVPTPIGFQSADFDPAMVR